jgi:hypothetical protein
MLQQYYGVEQNRGSRHTSRGNSPQIWKGGNDALQWESIRNGEVDGYAFREDFDGIKTSAGIGAAEAFWDRGLKVFGDTGGFITAVDQIGGAVKIGSDGDNEGASVAQFGQPFQISRSYGTFAFEARVKASTIADSKNGFFLGLIDSTALTATLPIAAAGTLGDANFVGFHRLEGDGDQVDAVYKANGVTQVTVQADLLGVAPLSSALVADTYVKLGMRYYPRHNQLGKYYLAFFVDNLLLAGVQVASADGTDFPNDVRMGFVFATLNATGSTPGDNTIDWVQAGQSYGVS